MKCALKAKKAGAVAVAVLLLLMLAAGMLPMLVKAAAGDLYFISDLPAKKDITPGNSLTLLATVGKQDSSDSSALSNVSYFWYKDGALLSEKDAATRTKYGLDSDATKNSKITVSACTSADSGIYKVRILESDSLSTIHDIMSAECTVTVASTAVSKPTGSLYVTGYTVVDAGGAEVQKMTVGQKYKIVVGMRDGRFNAMPTKVDQYNNIVNVKVASTSSFATPSLGDVGMSTPKWVSDSGEIAYAATFNDIAYLGGDNKLVFDVSYVDNSVAMQTITVAITQGYDVSKVVTAKPTVMVESSNYGSQNVSAGSTFTLTLVSYNTSASLGISDVTTSLSLPQSLTLAGGTNTVLTSSVNPGASYTANFDLQAQSNAENGVANITVTYTFYTVGSDAQLTSSQIITVPIVQPERFSVTSLDVPDEVYAGEESSLTVNFVNKGKGTLYNLSAEISGNLETPGQSQYLGNLASGTEGSADFILKSEGVGTVSGTITLIYEDANGAEKRVTQDYSVPVSAAPSTSDMPTEDIPMEEPQAGLPWWGWVLIAAGVAGVGIGVGVGVKKAKAKKRAAELAEEDSEDEDDEV